MNEPNELDRLLAELRGREPEAVFWLSVHRREALCGGGGRIIAAGDMDDVIDSLHAEIAKVGPYPHWYEWNGTPYGLPEATQWVRYDSPTSGRLYRGTGEEEDRVAIAREVGEWTNQWRRIPGKPEAVKQADPQGGPPAELPIDPEILKAAREEVGYCTCASCSSGRKACRALVDAVEKLNAKGGDHA